MSNERAVETPPQKFHELGPPNSVELHESSPGQSSHSKANMKTPAALLLLFSIGTGLSITGCAVEPAVARKMSFPAAMRDLTAGFEVLRNTAPSSERRLGLAPTEVSASLELTTLANGELGVDLSAAPTSLFSKIGITGKQEQKVTRKNTVQITFKNIYVDKDGKPYDTTKPPPIIQQFMTPPETRADEE